MAAGRYRANRKTGQKATLLVKIEKTHAASLILTALLLASGTLLQAADTGTKPEAMRLLAKLPSINVNFKMGFQSADLGLGLTNDTPSRSEADVRKTLQTSPTNPAAWCELAGQLLNRATRDYLHEEHLSLEDIPQLLAAVQAGRLTSSDVQRVRQLTDEALGCFSKVIELAPEKLDGYVQRAYCRMFFGTSIQVLTDALAGKAPVLSSFVTAATFADLQQAARLCPDNVNLQSGFAYSLVMSDALAMSAKPAPAKDLGDALSERSRAAFAEIRPRLATLAARNDPGLAAHACEALAMIEFMRGATADAQKHGQRAVTLDPSRESAWELLVAMQLRAEHHPELLTVCAGRIQASDTVRNRYLLAKAYEQLDELDKTTEQLDIMLTREPDNFLATAGKAAVLLRRGEDTKAAEFLQRAATRANSTADRTQRADLLSLQAIQAVLRGDRNRAELHLGQALKLDKDNKNARAILRAMGP